MTQNAGESPAAVERENGGPGALSGHIAENIENIAAFQLREHQKLGESQRRIGSIGDIVGRPGYLLSLLSLIVVWIAANGLGPRFGWSLPLDRPPFAWLQGFLTLAGVITATVVLIAQNRHARLDSQRGHLGLQLSLLTEQKVTKLIHLLEELRHDLPMVEDRHDSEVVALQQHTDAAQVLSALETVVSGKNRAVPPTPNR
ncbi:MAG: DUF1003 domain-containing protein [Steroidobacteraceae bacterium]|jgi:uncharacterized membrane protein